MGYDLSVGSNGLRAETIDEMVKQTAARSYKFKQAVAVNPTSAWTETFYRENQTVLTGQTGNAITEIPVGANFPQASVAFEKVQARITKFGLEENIPWESVLSSQINVMARTTIRVTEGVVKAVDDFIWNGLTQNLYTDSNLVIQSFAIDYSIGRGSWDQTSAAIVDDLQNATRKIANYNYDTSDLICFVNPYNKQNIMKWIYDKGAQWMPLATDIVTNGRIGKVAGITLVESQSVAASYALVVKPKTCATYNELVSIRSTTVDDPYKSTKIRVVEEGSLELTDPKSICLIFNTQHSTAA